MTLPPEKVGDKGQRYAIAVRLPDGEVVDVGYGPRSDSFADAIRMHPSWRRGVVIVTDRETGVVISRSAQSLDE